MSLRAVHVADELRAIWNKYERQRDDEAFAARRRAEAAQELLDLNTRRTAQGLPMVSELSATNFQQLAQSQYVYLAPAKTWRDEMDAELLSAVKRYLNPTEP